MANYSFNLTDAELQSLIQLTPQRFNSWIRETESHLRGEKDVVKSISSLKERIEENLNRAKPGSERHRCLVSKLSVLSLFLGEVARKIKDDEQLSGVSIFNETSNRR